MTKGAFPSFPTRKRIVTPTSRSNGSAWPKPTRRPSAHKRMHLRDEPCGFVSMLAKNNLAYQMRFSIDWLECELAAKGTPHVLRLKFEGGDERNPVFWTLFADGENVAHGTGEFARECFLDSATAFLDVCRDAIDGTDLVVLSEREYKILCMVRKIAAI